MTTTTTTTTRDRGDRYGPIEWAQSVLRGWCYYLPVVVSWSDLNVNTLVLHNLFLRFVVHYHCVWLRQSIAKTTGIEYCNTFVKESIGIAIGNTYVCLLLGSIVNKPA